LNICIYFTGENQRPYFPGLTRGLVAVTLYYDGRASLVNALRALFQAHDGRTWSLGLSGDLAELVTKYTDQLLDEGLVNRILGTK
jgi:nuclear pore complex protein Nup205